MGRTDLTDEDEVKQHLEKLRVRKVLFFVVCVVFSNLFFVVVVFGLICRHPSPSYCHSLLCNDLDTSKRIAII